MWLSSLVVTKDGRLTRAAPDTSTARFALRSGQVSSSVRRPENNYDQNNQDYMVTLDSAIKELRELNMSVPKPPRLPTEEEVAFAEQQIGIQFNSDYRRYLLEASDVIVPTLEPATVTVPPGRLDLVENVKTAWTIMGVPRDLLPICEDNADYYCMKENGEIVFWSHDGASNEKWKNLATWIKEVWIDKG